MVIYNYNSLHTVTYDNTFTFSRSIYLLICPIHLLSCYRVLPKFVIGKHKIYAPIESFLFGQYLNETDYNKCSHVKRSKVRGSPGHFTRLKSHVEEEASNIVPMRSQPQRHFLIARMASNPFYEERSQVEPLSAVHLVGVWPFASFCTPLLANNKWNERYGWWNAAPSFRHLIIWQRKSANG